MKIGISNLPTIQDRLPRYVEFAMEITLAGVAQKCDRVLINII